MDLIQDKWLPVILFTGEQRRISLHDLLDDAIQDVAYPRADFQGAAWQMLIGILQCTVAPEDKDDWQDMWDEGIEPEQYSQALRMISSALQFGADKPSFLQSFDALETEYGSIAGLLIDAPGGNTLKLNKDHFVKRGSVEHICPYCAVMALFSVQTNAPAGGAGYRVGMRGGGPLTTLVVPPNESCIPLWKKLWLNVLPQSTEFTLQHLPVIFPWLASTKTSEKAGNVVTPDNAHPLQAYWGMPRRIELDFTHTEAGTCDLCGEHHDALLLQMRGKNYGVQYDSWRHPFSPYRQILKDPSAPWLAFKGQPGGLSYKDWLGLIIEREDKFNRVQPAQVARNANKNNELWCFAYDMDNAKARCWYQNRIPLINVPRPDLFRDVIYQVLTLASEALSLLKLSLKSALFENPKEAKVDFSMLDIAFWQETESAFRILQAVLALDPQRKGAPSRDALCKWEYELHSYLFQVFSREILTDPDSPDDILLRQLNAWQLLDGSYRKNKARKDLLALAEVGKKAEGDCMNINTAMPCRITNIAAQNVLLDWFATLSERYEYQDGKRINGRAWRAELKRMDTPYDVMMCEGYDALRQQLLAHMSLRPLEEMALALFASVAAHIKSHNPKRSFAAQMGEKLNGSTPCVSTLRFQRLQKAIDPETFCQQLIRAVKVRGKDGVNILSLADSIFLWMEEWQRRENHQPETSHPFERNRIRWANEYLSASHSK